MTDHVSPLSIEEARARVLRGVAPLGRERVLLDDAAGRVLAVPIASTCDWPRFDLSAMDGYAVQYDDIAGELPVTLQIVDDIPAGRSPNRILGRGEAARIMTGAPVPDGADTVVKREDTDESDASIVRVLARPTRGLRDNVRLRGEDFTAGAVLCEAGTVVDAGLVGLLASLGRCQIEVWRQPRVAIISTGDELVELDGPPLALGQIYNSSAYMLAAQVRKAGGIPLVLPIVRDEQEAIERALDDAAAAADCVLSIGGVSVGDYDLVRAAIEARSPSVGFWRVRIKPGKPLAFGRMGDVPLLGLPGNPVSSFVTFLQFGWPLLRKLGGHPGDCTLPRVKARTVGPLKGPRGRTELVRGRLVFDGDGAHFQALVGQGSGNLLSATATNALGVVPPGRVLAAGDELYVELFGEI